MEFPTNFPQYFPQDSVPIGCHGSTGVVAPGAARAAAAAPGAGGASGGAEAAAAAAGRRGGPEARQLGHGTGETENPPSPGRI
jgi:hypothetical protein